MQFLGGAELLQPWIFASYLIYFYPFGWIENYQFQARRDEGKGKEERETKLGINSGNLSTGKNGIRAYIKDIVQMGGERQRKQRK